MAWIPSLHEIADPEIRGMVKMYQPNMKEVAETMGLTEYKLGKKLKKGMSEEEKAAFIILCKEYDPPWIREHKQRGDTLCWYCDYFWCSWRQFCHPVKGWDATPGYLEGQSQTRPKILSYIVHSCPEFRHDGTYAPDDNTAGVE